MYLEYTKAFESKKPRITQIINDGDIVSEFILDNSNAGYGESVPAAEYVNNVTLYDSYGYPQGVGGYDVAAQANQQNVTGACTYIKKGLG